ncbi:hypothetical protein [Dictyobacter formicarum]|uniref:Uncharacterized protein n=1 Tax=Dictyobacter formicarum TaxID=2778368 RepID=A0ABQ3VJG0_9CHLR|nr:hypothetical protein [Dictyobacter formicarum]GHO86354.1 hypothetical protein KSZ_43600 [Dictyobacter formicarum]
MHNPNQGMDNPNQNPYTGGGPGNPDQGPYRQSDMNPPNQNPYQPNQPGQEPFRREAAPMPEQEPQQQGTPQPSWGQPAQEPYRREAMNMPEQEQYRGADVNPPEQGTVMGGGTMGQPGKVTVTDYTVPTGLPFNQQEWQALVTTPIQVSLAMMSVSPSGLIGMMQEAMAIGKSVQALQAQGNISQMLAQIGQQLTKGLEDMRAGRPSPFGDIRQMSQNSEMARNTALASCQRSAAILERASPQDAISYKQFVYSFAYNVAAAAREGGFLGLFGGEQISATENAFLNEIAAALGLQRS